MDINFSNPGSAEEELDNLLQKPAKEVNFDQITLNEDRIFKDLYNAATLLKDRVSWTKNLSITNKKEEAQKFRRAWKNDEKYNPNFEYSTFNGNPRTAIKLLTALNRETTKIDKALVNDIGCQTLDVEDLRNLFRGIFEEFKMYVRVAATVKDENKWRPNCLKIWSMDEENILESKKRLINTDFDTKKEEKDLKAAEIKQMWVKELERLGIDYKVEIRDVDGCFNIPENKTAVVAKGEGQERLYSKSEAEMLTIHELFHVARSYNGRKVTEESSLPPILGMHTPYYDQTEEGGAVYREFQTGVITPSKKKDYDLRTMAAYYTQQGLEFYEIVEKLVKLGARPKRAYGLAARNREILRHHIYLGGLGEWENRENFDPLMIGKVNIDWAEKLHREVEAEDGILKEPPVKSKDIFNQPGF